MNNIVTLDEIFAKAQDSLTPSFNSVQFEADVDNLSKAETENLLGTIQAEIIKGGDYDTLTEMRSIALDHIADIEKAVYADTPQNRKLGRVGQEYGGVGSRGGSGKTPQERQAAFKQKHSVLVEKWKKEGNIAGLKKEIAAIKMEYGSDRQTAEKKIKPLEDAIAAARAKKKNINIKAKD